MAIILVLVIFLSFVLLLSKYLKDLILNSVFSFGLTVFYINLLLVLISYITGSLNKNIFLFITLLLFGVVIFFNYRKIKFSIKLSKFEIIVIGIIIFNFILTLIFNIYWGIFSWDALTTYDLRAQYFHEINKITTIKPDDGIYFGVFRYPVLTTNVHLFFYLFKPAVPAVLYSLFLLFLSAGIGQVLYRMTGNKKYGLVFGTLLFFVNPLILSQSLIAYTTIPFAFYYCFSIIALYFFFKEKKYIWFILSGIFLGISFWLRMESFAFYAINILMFILIEKKIPIKNLVLYSLVTLSVGLIWYVIICFENNISNNFVYKFFYLGDRGDAIHNVKSFNFFNIFVIIKDFLIFINNPKFIFIWYAFIFFLIYKIKDNYNFDSLFFILAIGLNILMWGIVWFFAYNEDYMRLSGLRTILNFYPLVYLFVFYKFFNLIKDRIKFLS